MANLLEKNEPYYLKIYSIIKEKIFDGTFQPGEKIVESQLSKEFKVSKSPVREAIRILENEGLIVVKNTRLFVYEASVKDIKEVYAFRAAIESYTTRYFTEYATDEDIENLNNSLMQVEKLIEQEASNASIIEENIKFHRIILNKSGNEILIRHYQIINALINYYRNKNISGEKRPNEILKQHKEIFDYIKNRDSNNAEKRMIDHLKQDVEHLFEILEIDSTLETII